MTWRIRHAASTREEIQGITAVHRSELHTGFLSTLGDGPLTLLFEHAATSSTSLLLVAESAEDSRVVGFLLGTFHTGAFYKDFLKRRALRTISILGPRLLSPKRLFRMAETLLYPGRRSRALPNAELLDIAVLRSFQGSGVGQALYGRLCEILRDRGISEFCVTTGEVLSGAHRFYEARGARRVDDIEVHKGQTTRVYVCRTSEPYQAGQAS